MSENITVIELPRQDYRLGRNVVHDPRSRAFALAAPIDRSTWHDKAIRIYDPIRNPNQCHGECTGCAKAMEFNAVGNRRTGYICTMTTAHNFYSRATAIDVWEGTWPPDDTGSSGLAACKAAQSWNLGGEYRWLFGGADEAVQTIMSGRVVNIGTRWDWNMFNKDSSGRVRLGGGSAGGHQYILRGYDKSRDWVMGRCWWGDFRDFWISRTDLQTLLDDWGDMHVQDRA